MSPARRDQLREIRGGYLRFRYVTALDQIEEALNHMEKMMQRSPG